MRAKLKFVRIDEDPALSEPELVFEVVPSTHKNISTKNRWLIRVAYKALDKVTNGTVGAENQKVGTQSLIQEARDIIRDVMGIQHGN